MGFAEPKAFLHLGGRPIFMHSVERFLDVAGMIVLTVPAGYAGAAAAVIERRFPTLRRKEPGDRNSAILLGEGLHAGKEIRILRGGRDRQASVELAVRALEGWATATMRTHPGAGLLVAVHDTARPLVNRSTVERAVRKGAATGAAIVAVPAVDTIKQVRGGFVRATLNRSSVVLAQTPQVFHLGILQRALAAGRRIRATDCSTLVEHVRRRVAVVHPNAPNPKITVPEDLDYAELLLRQHP